MYTFQAVRAGGHVLYETCASLISSVKFGLCISHYYVYEFRLCRGKHAYQSENEDEMSHRLQSTNIDQPYATHCKKLSTYDSLSKRRGETRGSFLPFHSSTVCSLSSSCLSVIAGGGWKHRQMHVFNISVLTVAHSKHIYIFIFKIIWFSL